MIQKVFAQRTFPLEKDISDVAQQLGAQGGGSALGILLNQIMFIVIGVAIVLAIFAIIRGGFEYMTSSDSGDKKSRAKGRIQAAFGGLLLAVSSILILNTINTRITSFDISFPVLQKVERPPLPEEVKSYDTNNDNKVTYPELKGKLDPSLEKHLQELIANSGLLDLNPRDLATFLPNGNTIEGWSALIHQMILYESGFKTSKTYKEDFNNDAGERTISTGLLQLSYESTNYYGFNVTTEKLKDPYVNLEAGVKILKKQVQNHNSIGSYSESYWSVLRPSSDKRRLIIDGLN